MKFKDFLKEEITGTDGLTIYHKRSDFGFPKGWDEDLKHFYNSLPESFVFSTHFYTDHKEREKLNIQKKHLGSFDQFKKGVFEIKYDNGKMVGATVDISNLDKTEDFKDIADPTQKYAFPLMNINLKPTKTDKKERDWSTWKKVGYVKTIYNYPKNEVIKVNSSQYSHDPKKGRV